jgi:hypothetical protein
MGALIILWALSLSSIRADGLIRRDEKLDSKSPFDADAFYGDHWYS